MNIPEVWVAIATTDRPDAFERLCADLTAQAVGAGVRVGLLIVENSRAIFSRQADRFTLARLKLWGVRVLVDDDGAGEPIDRSRERLRALVRRAQAVWPAPRFVWMLDDDVRLIHMTWRDGQITNEPFHNHLRFLLDLADCTPRLDVLVGEVTGDPPIPPIATLTSRLGDLAANLRWMFAQGPDAPWSIPSKMLQILAGQDAYYDFSVDTLEPVWVRPISWLPRQCNAAVIETCTEMLVEAAHIPLGIGFTRPILAAPDAFDRLTNGTRRGANAVFFDPSACLEHSYPTAVVRGTRTRRSDMVGMRILAARRPDRVKASRFSVLHGRPRGVPWPRRDELLASLIGDTLGSILVRSVDAALLGRSVVAGVDTRVDRIRGSFRAMPGILLELQQLSESRPPWAPIDVVQDLISWARAEVPGAIDGQLPSEVAESISASDVRQALREKAADLAVEVTAEFIEEVT